MSGGGRVVEVSSRGGVSLKLTGSGWYRRRRKGDRLRVVGNSRPNIRWDIALVGMSLRSNGGMSRHLLANGSQRSEFTRRVNPSRLLAKLTSPQPRRVQSLSRLDVSSGPGSALARRR